MSFRTRPVSCHRPSSLHFVTSSIKRNSTKYFNWRQDWTRNSNQELERYTSRKNSMLSCFATVKWWSLCCPNPQSPQIYLHASLSSKALFLRSYIYEEAVCCDSSPPLFSVGIGHRCLGCGMHIPWTTQERKTIIIFHPPN